MTAPFQRQAPGDRPRDSGRQPKIAALQDLAARQARTLRTGEDWASVLRLAARFPGQSFTNILLIAAQRPGATVIAGYQAWQTRGRQVARGEPGIRLISGPPAAARTDSAPPAAAREGRPITTRDNAPRERIACVWDITQTSGPPLPAPEMPASAAGRAPPPGLRDALTWLARRAGFAVDRTDAEGADSLTDWGSRRIRIRPGLDDVASARALVHELGHVLLHDTVIRPPGATAAGCRGVQKVKADSIAFIIAARAGLDTPAYSWPYVAAWAGSDPRARPEAAIRAAGERITTATATIASHLDITVLATPSPPFATGTRRSTVPAGHAEPERDRAVNAAAHPATGRASAASPAPADLSRILLDAEYFYLRHLERSWVPGYLAARGFGQGTAARWRIGYAPASWTALISHLRSLGYDDAVIEAAGLARRSSGGTLIDQFRDRVMLAIRGEHATIAGFIGRARPAARDGVPRYLNSPETAAFTKGDLLFGLHEARGPLASGAVPVLTEGPFDAIAVTAADPVRYAGLTPCGTALTSRQAAALSRAADLRRARVLLALDGDGPGRDAVIKAHGVLLSVTRSASAVILPAGRDPAEILQADGPGVLSNLLHHRAEPLARIVIDVHMDRWAGQLRHAEGQLNAMRSAAAFIASTLPPETSRQVLQITGGDYLETLDESLHPIASPEVPAIAQTLPPDAICQIMRVADRLSSDCSEVTAELANAITKSARTPRRGASQGSQGICDGRSRGALAFDGAGPGRLAAVGFPAPPAPPQARRQASTAIPRQRSSRRWTAIPPPAIRKMSSARSTGP